MKNESASTIKSFNTLNYEGSQSKVKQGTSGVNADGVAYNTFDVYNNQDKPGWTVSGIVTDKQSGSVKEFIEKEGKWFNYIKGNSTIKTSSASFQGIGIINSYQTV